MKAREARLKVNIPARVRVGAEWMDLRIENLSSRGMMVKTKTELKAGIYIEVRHGNMIIIGRVVWTQGVQSGVRSQDRINVSTVLRESAVKSTPAASATASQPAERRKDKLRLAKNAISERAERSRSLARTSQFIVMGTSAAAGCAIVASIVAHLLGGMSVAINAALG